MTVDGKYRYPRIGTVVRDCTRTTALQQRTMIGLYSNLSIHTAAVEQELGAKSHKPNQPTHPPVTT